ncbi:carboxymuconolactone decarboxylase family protein [Rouxiella badensis]|jgi:4-carboxymuconolactone decarboxylase|uniref:carboxymuconolactone decarboxylase family protein n=1 Tax=Rouxiella badensis TaxID=1646377 RepID=UPI003C3C4C14
MSNQKFISTTPTFDDIQAVAPALKDFTKDDLLGKVWGKKELSPRDRSIITLAAVITRNLQAELPPMLVLAIENGVKFAEISEIITHLAFYAGWGNAMSAILPTKKIFEKYQVDTALLPKSDDELLPIDENAEAQRAEFVEEAFGCTSAGVVKNTTDYLFRNLWLRSALAPRDRSLVTVAALIAAGQVAQIPYHLNRALDNGLTQVQASEVLTHLAFYAGWPNIFSSLTVFKEVFANRKK